MWDRRAQIDTALKVWPLVDLCHIFGCPVTTPIYLGISLPAYVSCGEIGPHFLLQELGVAKWHFSPLPWQIQCGHMTWAGIIECSKSGLWKERHRCDLWLSWWRWCWRPDSSLEGLALIPMGCPDYSWDLTSMGSPCPASQFPSLVLQSSCPFCELPNMLPMNSSAFGLYPRTLLFPFTSLSN